MTRIRRAAKFFEEHRHVALTFGDVRLKTGFSEVMPDAVDLISRFSRSVPLKVPVVSAAMDTVTEHRMAIALAMLGGLGVIHRNLTPKRQATEVARVKYYLNGFIQNPICVQEADSVGQVLALREEKQYPFHSFLVTDKEGRLVGVLTGNDFDFCDDPLLSVSQVMSKEVKTGRAGTSIKEAYRFMMRNKHKLLPLVDEEKRVVGLYTFSDVSRVVRGKLEGYNVDGQGQLRVGAAIGTGPQAIERATLLVSENVDVIVIDTAHADSAPVVETLRELKRCFPTVDVVAGNVSEGDSVKHLIEAGADGIRVGQGPGSICTTRVVTGVGCPQLTAIYNCSVIADEYDVPICGDGGIRESGDITMAIGAGASSVMLGRLLAGTKESPGDIVFYEGQEQKLYRGMGSLSALLESESSRERYLQSVSRPEELVPEGVESRVPYKGELARVMLQYLGGLRHGMGYVGAASIAQLQEKADFYFITNAGLEESHPHDVAMTKAAPNYERR